MDAKGSRIRGQTPCVAAVSACCCCSCCSLLRMMLMMSPSCSFMCSISRSLLMDSKPQIQQQKSSMQYSVPQTEAPAEPVCGRVWLWCSINDTGISSSSLGEPLCLPPTGDLPDSTVDRAGGPSMTSWAAVRSVSGSTTAADLWGVLSRRKGWWIELRRKAAEPSLTKKINNPITNRQT